MAKRTAGGARDSQAATATAELATAASSSELAAASELAALVERIERDLGQRFRKPPLADTSVLPAALRELYALSDGFAFPFGEIAGASQIQRDGLGDGWIGFGFDGYFSYYLCRSEPDDGRSFQSWDHESGDAPEAEYATACAWLGAEYEDYVGNPDYVADIVVDEVPAALTDDAAALTELARRLGREHDLSPRALVLQLQVAPVIMMELEAPRALAMMRSMQAAGIDCHIRDVRDPPDDGDDDGSDDDDDDDGSGDDDGDASGERDA